MLRAFLARFGLSRTSPDQLELSLGATAAGEGLVNEKSPRQAPAPRRRTGGPSSIPPSRPNDVVPKSARVADKPRAFDTSVEVSPARPPRPTARQRAEESATFLQLLQSFGLRDIDTLRLTRNRATMVSFRGRTLRLHEGFVRAPADVQRAIAVFVSGRGHARREARRIILAYEIERSAPVVRRRETQHPDDAAIAERLTLEHRRLNAQHFGGTLRPVNVRVSRRMKSRLGHFAPGGGVAGDIVVSRRHIRRHGWREAFETLLHEMVHQWQEETSLPLDHGPDFRKKAREVGVAPSARRILR
ncbi:MAG: SprT-like domain-containing protein [Gemmatimonadaceae bacterium]